MTELSTDNLLHPRQVNELNDEKAQLERMLGSASFIRGQLADDGANVTKQIKGIDKMLEQAPEPIPADQIDGAVKTEKLLRESWREGMPTKAEMRRNPPGATDKNMAWHKRTKTQVAQWKHLRRRLHASGISKHKLADEGDVSNIEMFRPEGGSGEMSLDNAQIPQTKTTNLPPPGAGPMAVMSESQAEMLKSINPELHGKMALLSNDQRAEVLGLVDSLMMSNEPLSDNSKMREEREANIARSKQTRIIPDRTADEEQAREEREKGNILKSKKLAQKRRNRASYNDSELAHLRAEAKALGINSYGKGREDLGRLIAERKAA